MKKAGAHGHHAICLNRDVCSGIIHLLFTRFSLRPEELCYYRIIAVSVIFCFSLNPSQRQSNAASSICARSMEVFTSRTQNSQQRGAHRVAGSVNHNRFKTFPPKHHLLANVVHGRQSEHQICAPSLLSLDLLLVPVALLLVLL